MNFRDRVINKFWRSIPWPSAVITTGGRKYKIPRIVGHHFYKASFQSESWLIQLFASIHKNCSIECFVDVGVNIGQTLLKIKSVNPSVQYIGFEPNPYCCVISQQIIQQNKLSDCRIISCGLSDRNQILKLQISSDDLMDSSASLVEGFRPFDCENKKFRFVNVVVLDDVWHTCLPVKVDLIKIDIEGAELEAFRGMMNIIKKDSPVIIMEVLPSYNIENKVRINRQLELAQLITKADYSIYQILNKETNLQFEKTLEFPIHKNVSESDYILTPSGIDLRDLI